MGRHDEDVLCAMDGNVHSLFLYCDLKFPLGKALNNTDLRASNKLNQALDFIQESGREIVDVKMTIPAPPGVSAVVLILYR